MVDEAEVRRDRLVWREGALRAMRGLGMSRQAAEGEGGRRDGGEGLAAERHHEPEPIATLVPSAYRQPARGRHLGEGEGEAQIRARVRWKVSSAHRQPGGGRHLDTRLAVDLERWAARDEEVTW